MFQAILTGAMMALVIAFFLWRIVAMICGLSYRRRWVRAAEGIAIAFIIGICAFIHFAWKSLYKPGTGELFFTTAAIYAVLVILFSGCAFIMDNAYRRIRASRNAPRTR